MEERSARMFKVSGYLVDPNGEYQQSDIIKALDDLLFGRIEVEVSDPYTWDDNLPENQFSSTMEDFEKRFNEVRVEREMRE